MFLFLSPFPLSTYLSFSFSLSLSLAINHSLSLSLLSLSLSHSSYISFPDVFRHIGLMFRSFFLSICITISARKSSLGCFTQVGWWKKKKKKKKDVHDEYIEDDKGVNHVALNSLS